jgi:two-component system chemotaxis response regulator CheB
MTGPEEPLRVLVVDDSAFNRRGISALLGGSPAINVVGNACDGEEALRMVADKNPDAITLDLEMPKMDGFTFLRILMSTRPTPVIVISSYSQKENVFKALELGALDFVAKPAQYDPDFSGIADEVVSKVLLARSIRSRALTAARQALESLTEVTSRASRSALRAPAHVVAIASSTGGPSALMEIITQIPGDTTEGIVIAQHMPDKFTRTFAERLNKRSEIEVSEAKDVDQLTRGSAFVCPGRHCMELNNHAGRYTLSVTTPSASDRYVPSADRLLWSVARAAGAMAVGVILTGMGDDGVVGAREILARGGTVIAESEETAVVYGMPGSAVRAGVTSQILPLGAIASYLAGLGR